MLCVYVITPVRINSCDSFRCEIHLTCRYDVHRFVVKDQIESPKRRKKVKHRRSIDVPQSWVFVLNFLTSRLTRVSITEISRSSRQKNLGTTQIQLQLVRLNSGLSSANPAVFCPIVIDLLGGIEPSSSSCESAVASQPRPYRGWILGCSKTVKKNCRLCLSSSKPFSTFRNVTYYGS